MQFLYPTFLYALAAIAIPIVIHLFYFRRFRKVYFTNVKYLKEIKEETSNRNKLKNLLVLLLRILAIAALVFAFAQPFIPKSDQVKTGNNAVSVFVDNSFSMTASQDEIPLLDIAKDKARNIVNAYSGLDKFQILTHDFEGKHQRLLTKTDAIAYIDEIEYTPFVQNMVKVLNRQKQLLDNSDFNQISYIISDFQKSISDIQEWKDSLMEVNLLPVQSLRLGNVSVDSAWFDGPVALKNQRNNLIVKVKNSSPTPAEQVRLSFQIEGQEKPIGIRDIPANSYVTDTVAVIVNQSGWQSGTLSVSDFPVQFDDKYFISFRVPDTIKALSINQSLPDKYLSALFSGVGYFSLTNQQINQLQYQTFATYDLIILNDLQSLSSGLSAELGQYIMNGGKVLLFPALNADLTSYNQMISQNGGNNITGPVSVRKEVSGINTDEFIFNDVYINRNNNLKLPVTMKSYSVNRSQNRSEEQLLSYRDGSAYLVKYVKGDGQLFVCASPLSAEVNDLVLNAEVFVPMLYKMAVSRSRNQEIANVISNKVIIETENKRKTGDFVYQIKGAQEFIPGQTALGNKIILDLNNQIRTAGIYDLLLDEKTVGKYAFNYDRKESDLSLYSESELEKLININPSINLINAVAQANISSTVIAKDKGVQLWKWFLIAALVFLGLEILLLRFWKN
ncbi:MAG: BatA domain-containing protein [Saprospiraceae bacterium]|nr:BatA domain-containing protein [Saprospiraceae bacterium]